MNNTIQKEKHINKKTKKTIIIVSSIVVVFIILISVAASIFLDTKNTVKNYRRNYNINEINVATNNTFKKLNNINYPNLSEPLKSDISEQENESYINFANQTYRSLINNNKDNNISYSSVNMYSLLNELYKASSRDDLTNRFDNLLGLDENQRITLIDKIMKANSFVLDETTGQIKNAAFFSNKYNYSTFYVDYLSDIYCEAYQLDFNKDINKIVSWVNQAVNDDKFIDEKFLELNDESVLYLMSTLYFKNAWNNKYLNKNNIVEPFYLNANNQVETTFMNHSYFIEEYYDYGDYISFRDYYRFGYYSITYLIPKQIEHNIYDLTKDKNIFVDDENFIIRNTSNEYNPYIAVDLTTPKFSISKEIDFKTTLSSLGFEDIFNNGIDSFSNAFDIEKPSLINFYLQKIKQKNNIEFNEDGTIIKSLSMAAIGAMSAAPITELNTLEVKLNQPFIYIIKDINDLPIFVGHIDNPTND